MTTTDAQLRNSATPHFLALGLLLALTVAMFADVLFASKPIVLSSGDTDLIRQFIYWREFGFRELGQGNLALWNPHLFSGAPFFGGFQSALLYPPNVLFLLLPLAKAINWSIALHVFLAGAFVYGWTAHRGLHPLGCFLAAVMFMFGGAHFLHIYAGHLPNLCAMVWAPLLFLAIDGWFEKPALGWCLLGMLAVAMQILAGHPQYVFYTGVGAGVYCVLCLVRAGERPKILLGLAAIGLGGAALSAVQLLTGLLESRETLRSAGLSYHFAAAFSFPPENILTLVAPGFFGNMKDVPYWGRWWLWEMSVFVSVTGLVLAVYGAAAGERRTRRFSLTMVCVLLVLALGAHTPLFNLLYHWVPGFDKFRGNSKFIFLASLFLAMLAANGLDRLIKRGGAPRKLAFGSVHALWSIRHPRFSNPLACSTGLAAVLLVAAALCVQQSARSPSPGGWWAGALKTVYESREGYVPGQPPADASFVLQAGRQASQSLLIAGGTVFTLAVLLFLATRVRKLPGVIVLLATVELFVFARSSLETFDLAKADLPELRKFLAEHPGDYRILNLLSFNAAMSVGAYDISGYDAGVPLRYAQFMAFTQGLKPDEATQFLSFSRLDRLYAMLRWRFSFEYGEDGNIKGTQPKDMPLERLQLIRNYRVIINRDDIFAAMAAPSFDPRQEVILESEPNPQPAVSVAKDELKAVDSSTDSLSIEAELSSPAILLITDNYSKSWRVESLGGAAQAHYEVLPANYCLRAIPLAAGHHRIRVEYVPSGFTVGKWISGISASVCAGLLLWVWRGKPRGSFPGSL